MEFFKFYFSYFFAAIGGAGALWLILSFLAKRLLDQKLKQEMEKYKSELSQKVEVLKTQLSIFCHEQTISISRVDKERADAIKSVHLKLIGWGKIAGFVMAKSEWIESNEEKFKYNMKLYEDLINAYVELSNCSMINALYFDDEMYERLHGLIEGRIANLSNRYRTINIQMLREKGFDSVVLQMEQQADEMKRIYFQEIVPLTSDLAQEFRRLLGVTK